MSNVPDITADIVSLVKASGISGDDVFEVTVTVNPPGMVVRCTQRDLNGEIIIDTNGEPMVANVGLTPVTVDQVQFCEQT